VDASSGRDPSFLRYKSAWLAYHALKSQRAGESAPNLPSAVDVTDPLQVAAAELAAARDDWLADPSKSDR
jgi:hypothetical protein